MYHKQIENIFESFNYGILTVDGNWIVNYWNTEAEHILKRQHDDIIGKNLWETYPELIPLKFYTETKRAMRENISVHFDEYFPTLKIWIEVGGYLSGDVLSIYFKDITSRKMAEDQINREKEKYQNLFDLSPIPQWVFNIQNLRFLDVNDAAVRLYGYTKEEFLSMTIKDIRPAEDIGALENIIENLIKKGLYNKLIVKHLKKSGEIIYANVEGNSIHFDGVPARLVHATDVTEKIKAEHLLTKSEQRFKALVQDGSDLIAIIDPAGNYQYVSPNSKSILGIDAEYFIGKNIFDFIHQDDLEMIKHQFSMVSVKKRIEMPVFRFIDVNNEVHWIETIITDMSRDLTIAGIVANSRVVTERIENENKIKAALERYNIVSIATSDAIYECDLLTDETIWNKGIKGIFGHNLAETSTLTWWKRNVHPEDIDRIDRNFQQCIKKKKKQWKAEYRFRSAEGTYRYVLDRSFLVYDVNGIPERMLGSLQDITDQINYIKAIEEQNAKLRDIAWFQSHVVRAPLTRIMGIISLLKDFPEDKHSPELLEHLFISAHELDEVIHSIVKRTSEVQKQQKILP